MNFEKRYRNSQLLFGLNLLLLAGFLFVWLCNVYEDKSEELDNQVSYLWIKSVKEIEGKDFSKIIFTAIASNISTGLGDSLEIQTIEKRGIEGHEEHVYSYNALDKTKEFEAFLEMDSTQTTKTKMLFIDSSSTVNLQTEINFSIDSPSETVTNISKEMERKISNVMSKFAVDIKLAEAKLDSELVLAAIPIQYDVEEITTTVSPFERSQNKFYVRTATGSQFSLKIVESKNYILQKMWFEFLMSALLLSLIGAAFYYILRSLKEQNQLVHIKNELISNITHELRTPIFTVSAALEALQSFNGLENPERTKEYLSISQNELNRLSILVEKVLKTSLFEQSVIQINKEQFELNGLVQRIANSLQFQLEKEQATLNIHTSSENILAFADKIHLTTVVYNLIDNALKYSSNRPPVINIHLNDLEKELQITISDNGIGVPKEYLNQIFDKFFRVPQGNQHNVKGYGLGLNYVFSIIQQHGGTITATSQLGEGTQFLIRLPKTRTI